MLSCCLGLKTSHSTIISMIAYSHILSFVGFANFKKISIPAIFEDFFPSSRGLVSITTSSHPTWSLRPEDCTNFRVILTQQCGYPCSHVFRKDSEASCSGQTISGNQKIIVFKSSSIKFKLRCGSFSLFSTHHILLSLSSKIFLSTNIYYAFWLLVH